VLDAEITTASGKTKRGGRNSRLDSEHEPGEPVVGSLLKLGIEVAQSTVAKSSPPPPHLRGTRRYAFDPYRVLQFRKNPQNVANHSCDGR